jgi:hypothetical protein
MGRDTADGEVSQHQLRFVYDAVGDELRGVPGLVGLDAAPRGPCRGFGLSRLCCSAPCLVSPVIPNPPAWERFIIAEREALF